VRPSITLTVRSEIYDVFLDVKDVFLKHKRNKRDKRIFDKFIRSVDISFFLKSNSISISISNRDVGSVSWATSRFEIEIKVEFEV